MGESEIRCETTLGLRQRPQLPAKFVCKVLMYDKNCDKENVELVRYPIIVCHPHSVFLQRGSRTLAEVHAALSDECSAQLC